MATSRAAANWMRLKSLALAEIELLELLAPLPSAMAEMLAAEMVMVSSESLGTALSCGCWRCRM